MLQEELKKHIRKVSFPLKEGKELELALKAKLTKKEFKLLKALASNELSLLQSQLNIDDVKLKELESKLIKKLNQEKVKQELYNFANNDS
jgi:predicted nucleic acid-binding protein